MPTRALFDECMEEIKASYPSNYETLMSKPLHKWAHHAAPKDLALFGTVTSNNAESTIAMIGSEVGTEFFCPWCKYLGLLARAGTRAALYEVPTLCLLMLMLLGGGVAFFAKATCH